MSWVIDRDDMNTAYRMRPQCACIHSQCPRFKCLFMQTNNSQPAKFSSSGANWERAPTTLNELQSMRPINGVSTQNVSAQKRQGFESMRNTFN